MHYKCSNIQTLIPYQFKLLQSVISSHSRVKDFPNSYLSRHFHHILRQDRYINVNYDSTILCKIIILVMSYVEFFKV